MHKGLGRKAHHSFLGSNFRIYEDMSLQYLQSGKSIIKIQAFPLIVDKIEATPVIVIGQI
jgi:hypothetical protein